MNTNLYWNVSLSFIGLCYEAYDRSQSRFLWLHFNVARDLRCQKSLKIMKHLRMSRLYQHILFLAKTYFEWTWRTNKPSLGGFCGGFRYNCSNQQPTRASRIYVSLAQAETNSTSKSPNEILDQVSTVVGFMDSGEPCLQWQKQENNNGK